MPLVRNRNSLATAAYQELRQRLRHEEPGALLNEGELARQLKMSRTPVREALSRLTHEGLVRTLPNRGILVPVLSASDVEEIYAIREALEGLAAHIAAIRRTAAQVRKLEAILERAGAATKALDREAFDRSDREFHEWIAEASHNSRLSVLLAKVRDEAALDPLRARTYSSPHRLAQSFAEHRILAKAIVDANPAMAERASRAHARSYLQSALSSLRPSGKLVVLSSTSRESIKVLGLSGTVSKARSRSSKNARRVIQEGDSGG